MANDGRPVWLRILLIALPIALLWALQLGAIAWALAYSTSSDVRAAAGGVALWLVGDLALLAYQLSRYSLLRHPSDVAAASALRETAKRWRLIAVANNVGPGLCIGLVAKHPLSTVIATRLATYQLWRLQNLCSPPQARVPVAWRKYYRRFLLELAVLCTGAVVGRLLRLLI
jgi:hypothetical protein